MPILDHSDEKPAGMATFEERLEKVTRQRDELLHALRHWPAWDNLCPLWVAELIVRIEDDR